MPVVNASFRTVSCDAPGCTKEVTFEATNGLPPDVMEANPWLKTNRVVQTADGRMFDYCSDVCNVEGVKTGLLNAPEPKQVEQVAGGGGAVAIAMAAAENRRKQLADKNIREGQPAKIQLG